MTFPKKTLGSGTVYKLIITMPRDKYFVGTTTAIVTPFAGNGDVDYDHYERLIKTQTDAGINTILVGGTTGEAPSLTLDELVELTKFTIEQTKGTKTKVMVGVGTNCTHKSLDQVEALDELPVDGFLFSTPYYNKPTQDGLIRHFKSMASATEKPIILYNIPGRAGVNINVETIVKLAHDVKHIVGVKESAGDVGQIMDIIQQTEEDFTVLSGEAELDYILMALGGDGVISVTSNAFPKLTKQMVDFCLKGKWAEARKANYDFLPVLRTSFIETNPIPIKMALSWMHIIRDDFRGPMTKIRPENEEIWRPIVEKFAEKEAAL